MPQEIINYSRLSLVSLESIIQTLSEADFNRIKHRSDPFNDMIFSQRFKNQLALRLKETGLKQNYFERLIVDNRLFSPDLLNGVTFPGTYLYLFVCYAITSPKISFVDLKNLLTTIKNAT